MGYAIEVRPGVGARPASELRTTLQAQGLALAPGGAPLVLEQGYGTDEATVRERLQALARVAASLGYTLFDPQGGVEVGPESIDAVTARFRTYRSLASDLHSRLRSERPEGRPVARRRADPLAGRRRRAGAGRLRQDGRRPRP
ncbi:MAG: hypothetical protein QM765_26595 [Myxococcales bacterium]